MSIYVKTLNGQTFHVPITPKSQVFHITNAVNKITGFSVYQMRLHFKGRNLRYDFFLSEYGIVDGEIIHFVLRMGGGPQLRHYLQEMFISCKSGEEELWRNEDYRVAGTDDGAGNIYVPKLVVGAPRSVSFVAPSGVYIMSVQEPSEWDRHISVTRTPKGGHPEPVSYSITVFPIKEGMRVKHLVAILFPYNDEATAATTMHPCPLEFYEYRVIIDPKGEIKCISSETDQEWVLSDKIVCNFTVKRHAGNCAVCERPLYGHLFTCEICEEQLHADCCKEDRPHVCRKSDA